MKMKKIIATSMSAAMDKVKSELGEDAVILQSKELSEGGIFGFFKKKKYEVIAVRDDKQIGKNKEEQNPIIQMNEQVNSIDVQAEINALKSEISSYKQQTFVQEHYPLKIQHHLNRLRDIEMDERYIDEIAQQLLMNWRNSLQEPSDSEIYQWVSQQLNERMSHYMFREKQTKQCINIVGPTGVGKTTTIAKIAAQAVLEQKQKVAFITLDTYRIAAIEQLKTYAELLKIPVEVVYETKDLKHALESFKEYDLILIDTAGRNYRDEIFVSELKKQFTGVDIETLLVLPISMKERDLCTIVDNFLMFGIDFFLFTKADETRSYGAMFNLMTTYKLGASYITNGQEVPDDLQIATPEKITSYLLGEQNEK